MYYKRIRTSFLSSHICYRTISIELNSLFFSLIYFQYYTLLILNIILNNYFCFWCFSFITTLDTLLNVLEFFITILFLVYSSVFVYFSYLLLFSIKIISASSLIGPIYLLNRFTRFFLSLLSSSFLFFCLIVVVYVFPFL